MFLQLTVFVRNGVMEYEQRNVIAVLRLREKKKWGSLCADENFICMQASIDQFPSARNPGEFDYGRYLELNDIHGVVSVLHISPMSKKANYTLSSFVSSAQNYFYRTLDRLHEKRYSSFLKELYLDTEQILLKMSNSPLSILERFIYWRFRERMSPLSH